MNKKIAEIFKEIVRLLDVKGKIEKSTSYRKKYYEKAIQALEAFNGDILLVYKKDGINGIKKELNVGDSIALKIEEYIKKKKIKDFEDLKTDTIIQQIVTHFFETKGVSLEELKTSARKRKIVYARYTRPAKELIELAGSVKKAEAAIDKVAKWANSRKLDYTIETVAKKWLELDRLKPKKIKKKPFYDNKPMVWLEIAKKWYVVDDGQWLEFADKEEKIEWREIK